MPTPLNEYVTCDDVTFIFMTNGFTIIDTEDANRAKVFNWTITGRYVAARMYGMKSKVSLSRYIMSFPENLYVDHINGNCFDNTKTNLRTATPKQNAANKKFRLASGGYRGVYKRFFKRGSFRYEATICNEYLGSFTCPIMAARAYDKAAIRHHGEFAKLNFPEESQT